MGKNIVIPNNVNLINFSSGLQGQFFGVWKLSRALKSVGWVYKGSSDGYTKESTGATVLDKWGPGSIYPGHTQLGSQTGAAATVGTISRNVVTINGLTGMTSDSVGQALTLSGSNTLVSNGTFTIIAFNSSSSVNIINNNIPVADATNLTWSERVSGSASITWSAPSSVREQTITGLTGVKEDCAYHYVTLRGASNGANNGIFRVIKVLSSTSIVINNPSGISETASGNWTMLDPVENMQTVAFYNFIGVNAWICMQGPSTLKIPINAASTGNFARGENITQSSTGAQGELVSYLYNASAGLTYLVVNPRVDGSGSGVHGWSTGATTITGGSSGATVTTGTSTPIEYVREIVLWKGTSNDYDITIYSQCVDSVGESSHRFSARLGNAGCTATIAPAGGGTGNAFPSIGSYCVRGAGGQSLGTTFYSTSTLASRFHIIATNIDYTSGVSADGSFVYMIGNQSALPGAQHGIFYQAVDNTENGDLDPYVWYAPTQSTNTVSSAIASYNPTRIGTAAGNSAGGDFDSFGGAANGKVSIFGWIGRGITNQDFFQTFVILVLGLTGDTKPDSSFFASVSRDEILSDMANYYVLRDTIYIGSYQTSTLTNPQMFRRTRKGTLRWIFATQGGQIGDTFDNKRWIQASSFQGAFIVGPWDGVSTMTQN